MYLKRDLSLVEWRIVIHPIAWGSGRSKKLNPTKKVTQILLRVFVYPDWLEGMCNLSVT